MISISSRPELARAVSICPTVRGEPGGAELAFAVRSSSSDKVVRTSKSSPGA